MIKQILFDISSIFVQISPRIQECLMVKHDMQIENSVMRVTVWH